MKITFLRHKLDKNISEQETWQNFFKDLKKCLVLFFLVTAKRRNFFWNRLASIETRLKEPHVINHSNYIWWLIPALFGVIDESKNVPPIPFDTDKTFWKCLATIEPWLKEFHIIYRLTPSYNLFVVSDFVWQKSRKKIIIEIKGSSHLRVWNKSALQMVPNWPFIQRNYDKTHSSIHRFFRLFKNKSESAVFTHIYRCTILWKAWKSYSDRLTGTVFSTAR